MNYFEPNDDAKALQAQVDDLRQRVVALECHPLLLKSHAGDGISACPTPLPAVAKDNLEPVKEKAASEVAAPSRARPISPALPPEVLPPSAPGYAASPNQVSPGDAPSSAAAPAAIPESSSSFIPLSAPGGRQAPPAPASKPVFSAGYLPDPTASLPGIPDAPKTQSGHKPKPALDFEAFVGAS